MPGNRKALLAVLGSCIAIFWPGALTFGFPGVMAPIWQEMFHVGRAATGMTIFFMLAAVGVFMFLVGRWQEHYGTRKMITLGIILTACSSVVAAYATSIYMVYAWAFLNGLASSFVYIPTLTLVQRWYPEKKGLVSGVVSMVFGLAAAIMAPLFGKMLATLGYQSMNLALALLTLAVGLTGAYFARAPDKEERALHCTQPAPQEACQQQEAGKISDCAGESAHPKLLVSLDHLDAGGSCGRLHDGSIHRLRTVPGLSPGVGGSHPDRLQPHQRGRASGERILLGQNRTEQDHEPGLSGSRPCLFHPSLDGRPGDPAHSWRLWWDSPSGPYSPSRLHWWRTASAWSTSVPSSVSPLLPTVLSPDLSGRPFPDICWTGPEITSSWSFSTSGSSACSRLSASARWCRPKVYDEE